MNTHPNPDTPNFRGLPGTMAVVFGLLALLLGIGGGWLLWRHAAALWLYALLCLATLRWSVWEAGLDWWQLAPRLDLFVVRGLPQNMAAGAGAGAILVGWTMAADGAAFRRVVASPQPPHVLGLQAIRWLLQHGALVIAAVGGGIPVARAGNGSDSQPLHGVAAVIDKDLCTSLLPRELQADVLVIATDVQAVYLD